MPVDYESRPPHQVRRADRALVDEASIKETLHSAAFGAFATVHEGQPFINSNLFVYDQAAHVIYFHTANVGRTQANLKTRSRICFNVSHMGRLLPADEALEFSVEYTGVTVFGQACIIEDDHEQRHALQLLLDKYFPHLAPGADYRPITGEELARTTVYRMDIEHWSGKKKAEAADFPGAFEYGQHHAR